MYYDVKVASEARVLAVVAAYKKWKAHVGEHEELSSNGSFKFC
jgi:hypothetical protein